VVGAPNAGLNVQARPLEGCSDRRIGYVELRNQVASNPASGVVGVDNRMGTGLLVSVELRRSPTLACRIVVFAKL
jgi:hypothetical protein